MSVTILKIHGHRDLTQVVQQAFNSIQHLQLQYTRKKAGVGWQDV